MNKIVLIELGLYAEAYYSGATYDETHMITREDFLKYYCNNEQLDDAELMNAVRELFNEKELLVGELDGKHSQVYGSTTVEFWDAEDIKEHYSDDVSNDSDVLLENMAELAGITGYNDKQQFKLDIDGHVQEKLDEIGVKAKLTVKVPKDKVEDLLAFVEKLNTDN